MGQHSVATLACFLAFSFASASRELALDHPSLMTAASSCRAEPQGACFSPTNILRRISSQPADPGHCCLACAAQPGCVTYNHGVSNQTDGYYCELFSTAGQIVHGIDGCAAGWAPSAGSASPRDGRPNIVFLVVESTDGRTWQPGYQDDVIPMPNTRQLQQSGVEFRRHYSNAPVCCPSRATFWSGRHASNIPHEQARSGMPVAGVWNNFEGLPHNYTDRIDQVLSKSTGYNVKVSGKTDWATGGHTENVYLNAWTMYTQFPYDVNATGGFYAELPHFSCASSGSVREGGGAQTGSAHQDDWKVVNSTTAWIKQVVEQQPDKPFFVFQGMNIVHPPYATNGYWNSTIDRSKIQVPHWEPLMQMHPCDYQSSMLKGCTPSDADAAAFYSVDRRREVRAKYYAMIAEWDAMVGEYMKAVKQAGVWNQTVFIVTSDHGDMQMEKQQFYKMVPYDASSSVPMVIFDGRNPIAGGRVVTETTQLIDVFPTIMDLVELPKNLWPAHLDGHTLTPLLAPDSRATSVTRRPSFVVSQFHGDDIAMSWFLVVQTINNTCYKLIVWGTGEQHASLLFDLDNDPSESNNLIGSKQGLQTHQQLFNQLDSSLRSVVDYPTVALSVAKYGQASLAHWTQTTPDWKNEIHKSGLRWSGPWNNYPNGSLAAVEQFLARPAQIQPCRQNLSWAPLV